LASSPWYKATIALLAITIALGVVTVWEVWAIAPRVLAYTSILVFSAFAVLLALSLKRIRGAFVANAVLAVIVLTGTFSSRAHFEFSEVGMLLPALIVYSSIPIQLLLAAVSLKAYGELSKAPSD